MGQKYEDDKFDGNYADEEDEIVIMIIGDIEKRDKYNVDDEKYDKDNAIDDEKWEEEKIWIEIRIEFLARFGLPPTWPPI